MNSTDHKHSYLHALLIVDLINTFSFRHGHILASKVESMLPNILYVRNLFSKNKLPIIYVNDHYKIENPTPSKVMDFCLNPLSFNIINEIKPSDNHFFVFKNNYSGFYQTNLDDLLKKLKVTHLIILGVAGNRCVLFTANDAFMRDYNVIIPIDAISSVTDYDHEISIYMMKDILNAKMIKSCEIENLII